MNEEIYKIVIQADYSQLKDMINEYKRLRETALKTLKIFKDVDNYKRPVLPDSLIQARDSASQMTSLQFSPDTLSDHNPLKSISDLNPAGSGNSAWRNIAEKFSSNNFKTENMAFSGIASTMLTMTKEFKFETDSSFKNMIASSKMIEASFKKDVSIVTDIMKVFASISSGDSSGILGSFTSLIGSFIPGASEILGGISGIIHALGGMPAHNAPTGGFNPIAASHSMNSLKQMPNINNYMISQKNQAPIELHVHVNSEIEKSKAVKFLINNMPAYNIHLKQKRI